MSAPIARFRRETETLYTAGQPSAGDLEWLRAEGFDAVVNVSTPSARNFLHDEAQRVLDLGMAYVFAPIDCSHLTPDHYALVRGALTALRGKKVLVHCAGNVKSSAMVHVWRAKELGHDAASLVAELRVLGWHEPKWYEYFRRLGVGGAMTSSEAAYGA